MITSYHLVVVFGLASAASWGAGDFMGGLLTRRMNAWKVLVISFGASIIFLTVLALLTSEPLPSATELGWGIAAGFSGTLALAAYYRALAMGKMGIAAPVAGVLTASVPVLFGVLTQGLPTSYQIVGFLLALVGLWLISRREGVVSGSRSLGFAVLAGLGFGGFLVLLAQASKIAIFWPIIAARGTGLTILLIIVVASRGRFRGGRGGLALMFLTGVLEVGGNAFFLLATQAGRIDVASVLSSLYPAATIILAYLLLKERMTRTQGAGILAVLIAIVLIAA
jgi:drug/metabolite transporter (DMT)-like permease